MEQFANNVLIIRALQAAVTLTHTVFIGLPEENTGPRLGTFCF